MGKERKVMDKIPDDETGIVALTLTNLFYFMQLRYALCPMHYAIF